MFKYSLTVVVLCAASKICSAADAPTVQYRALSDAARARGQLKQYEGAPCTAVQLKVGDAELTAQVPKSARAYDIVPINYTLTHRDGPRRAAVEATGFADSSAAAPGKKFYDLSVPGNLDVKIEYLGSVTGDIETDKYIPLTPDPKTPVSPYPIFKNDPLVCSSEIRAGTIAWYKWRLTNTGDTILDPEGFGCAFGEPLLTKLGPAGKEVWQARPINLFVRFLNYLAPGESTELWAAFWMPDNDVPHHYGIMPGDYRLDFKFIVRLNRAWDPNVNVWGGSEISRLSVPLHVTETGGKQPVQAQFTRVATGENMPGYIDAFEEFMTAFNVHRAAPTVTTGTVYLQVAPWTKNVDLKLILDQPMTIDSVRAPIAVSDDTLAVTYNPTNPMVLGDQPAFVAQAMPGMRSGIQIGPDPEDHLRAELREMKKLGVNVIVNTAGDWWIPEVAGSRVADPLAAQYKFYYDVVVREQGVKLMGWSIYPPYSTHWYAPAAALLKKPVNPEPADSRHTPPGVLIDLGDPLVPEVIAAWCLYDFHRWGDLWYKTKDGTVPIDIEDTWGWMRDDINIRYPLGKIGIQKFRDWLKQKRGTIAAVNDAWKSSFTSFEEIDPQANPDEPNNNPDLKPEPGKPNNVFHDWSEANADFDRFRTSLRTDIYAKTIALIRKEIPTAKFELRTEGANMVVRGDATSPDMHLRHLFYSQRRNAMLHDDLPLGDPIGHYSDYTTIPYTLEELANGTREMVKSGIRPAYLPCFNNMRDILINPHYGRSYQTSYGLAQPDKGMMIHCLMAAYPWWKTSYECGGAPGIIWSDFLCDGFATDTQKRELSLLTKHFEAMKRP